VDYERLVFLEPNLALEARPAEVGEAECWVDLEIGPEELCRASDTWLAELQSFPERRP